MTDQELEQFTALAKKYEAKDKDKVIGVIKADIQPVFQEINDGGRSAATVDLRKKIDDAEAKAKKADEDKKKAEDDLKALEGKAPEAAALKVKYEAEVTKVRDEEAKKQADKDKELLDERLEVAKSRLKVALDKLKINPEYSETILLNRADVVARLKPGPKGKVDVLKAGSQDLTIVAPEGKSPVDVLAEELVPTVPKDWIKSGVNKGSATTGSSGGGSGGVGERFTQIRTEVKEETKKKAERSGKRSGLERLSGSRA